MAVSLLPVVAVAPPVVVVAVAREWHRMGNRGGAAVSSAVFSAQRSSRVSSAAAAAFGLATPAKTQLEDAKWVLDLVAS